MPQIEIDFNDEERQVVWLTHLGLFETVTIINPAMETVDITTLMRLSHLIITARNV